MRTIETDTFDKMSAKSNIIGVEALKQFLKYEEEQWSIKVVEKKRSYNDLILFLGDKTILVEVKVRNKFYDNLMLEDAKYQSLLKKAKFEGADDAWYLSVADGQCIIYSLIQISQQPFVNRENDTIKLKDTALFKDQILKSKIYAPQTTAIGRNQGKFIEKLCWFLPFSMRLIPQKQKTNKLF